MGDDTGCVRENSRRVVKALIRFAGMMSEDKLVSGEFSPSLQAGKSRANDIMTNKTNPLYQKYQDGDRETSSSFAHC